MYFSLYFAGILPVECAGQPRCSGILFVQLLRDAIPDSGPGARLHREGAELVKEVAALPAPFQPALSLRNAAVRPALPLDR